MKEYALVLEGGGAKGAYQIGAMKALIENGFEFNTVIGTSIGAINAAFIAQGDIDKIEELWKTMSFKDLMDINNELVENVITNQVTTEDLKEIRKTVNRTIKDKGIDTKLMREIMAKYIDEDKIRNSKIRYGLVTFCITDFKPEKLFIEDIPKGKLIDYLLASSNLPGFKRAIIDEKSFLDGGAFDNCSVEMLYDAGYRDILALRLFRKNNIRNYNSLIKNKDLKLKMIVPSMDLPNILNFETKTLNSLLKYGYVDAIKQIKKLDGTQYVFNKMLDEEIEEYKKKFTPMTCLDITKEANVKFKPGDNIIEVTLNKTFTKINNSIAEHKSSNFKKQLINIIEYVAQKEKITPNKIYDFKDFVAEVKSKAEKRKKLKGIDKAIYLIIENI